MGNAIVYRDVYRTQKMSKDLRFYQYSQRFALL